MPLPPTSPNRRGDAVEPTFRFLTDADAARDALELLQSEAVVGLDTETYWDPAAKCTRVSLVQIAPRAGDVIVFDMLAVSIELLRPVIESPTVVMAAHNARFDEMVLVGAGARPAAFIDTLRMARLALDLPSYGLASVSEHLFGVALDKSLRQSNWKRRPLTRAQLAYAAADAHFTLRVYEELRRTLLEQGRLEEVLRVSMLKTDPSAGRAPRRKRAPQKPPVPLTAEEKRAVARLKEWRRGRAHRERVPPYMICHDRTLEHLAHERPTTLEALRATHGLGDVKIARYGEELLAALREAFD